MKAKIGLVLGVILGVALAYAPQIQAQVAGYVVGNNTGDDSVGTPADGLSLSSHVLTLNPKVFNALIVDAGTLWVHGVSNQDGVTNALIVDAGSEWVHGTSNIDGTAYIAALDAGSVITPTLRVTTNADLAAVDAGTVTSTGFRSAGVSNLASVDAGVVTASGAITGATTCDVTGIITGHSQVRAYTALIAGYGSFNYVQMTGSSTGAPIVITPVGGDSNVNIALQPLGIGFVSSTGGYQPILRTLQTCNSGTEGLISADSGSGVATAAQTRVCVCLSNGSSTYAWRNLLNPLLGTGTATTCGN